MRCRTCSSTPPSRDPQWVTVGVQPIAATDKTSGFEADLGSVQDVNGFDLEACAGPS